MLQTTVLFASFSHYVFGILMFLTSAFLILLVLIQRGRGGGLAGAFGGMGGQSAFGTKAGDLFTRVTMITAAFWILLAVAGLKFLGGTSSRFSDISGPTGFTAPPAAAGEGESNPEGASSSAGDTGAGDTSAGDSPGADSSGEQPGSETNP